MHDDRTPLPAVRPRKAGSGQAPASSGTSKSARRRATRARALHATSAQPSTRSGEPGEEAPLDHGAPKRSFGVGHVVGADGLDWTAGKPASMMRSADRSAASEYAEGPAMLRIVASVPPPPGTALVASNPLPL